MLVVRVVLQVKPENREELLDLMAKDSDISPKFDGCLMFNLFEDVNQPNTFILYEEWDSQANFDVYQKSDYLAGQSKLVFPLLAGEPNSAYYQSNKVN